MVVEYKIAYHILIFKILKCMVVLIFSLDLLCKIN